MDTSSVLCQDENCSLRASACARVKLQCLSIASFACVPGHRAPQVSALLPRVAAAGPNSVAVLFLCLAVVPTHLWVHVKKKQDSSEDMRNDALGNARSLSSTNET